MSQPYPDIRQLFVVSTAHLTQETAKEHNQYKEENSLWPIPYGYLCWMWDKDTPHENSIPSDLRDVITHLQTTYQAKEGDYIRFDCDGPTLNNLKTYTW